MKNPGVLFSLLHVAAYGVAASFTGPLFFLALGSLAVSAFFSAKSNGLIPESNLFSKLGMPKVDKFFSDLGKKPGTALFTNGLFLAGITAVGLVTGAAPLILASAGLFAVANMNKGAELNNWLSLSTIGGKYFSGDEPWKKLVRNTVFSSEFLASAGAGAIALFSGGWLAIPFVAMSVGTMAILGMSNNSSSQPLWKKIPFSQSIFGGISKIGQKLFGIKPPEAHQKPVEDRAMARYTMAGMSLGYALTTAFAAVATGIATGGIVPAIGLAFLAAAQIGTYYGNRQLGDVIRNPDPPPELFIIQRPELDCFTKARQEISHSPRVKINPGVYSNIDKITDQGHHEAHQCKYI